MNTYRSPIKVMANRGVATGQALLSKAWFRFWHGMAQGLMTIGCLLALVASVHDIHSEQSAADLFHAAKPCTVQQYAEMTGPTRWCVLTGLILDQSYSVTEPGYVIDLPAPSPISSYALALLDPYSPALDQLAAGDEVTMVATVQQFDGSDAWLAGSVSYQGVTAQTDNSPGSTLADDTETAINLAALVLFFGLWTIKSAFEWETAAWSGVVGSAFGLFCGVWIAGLQQWSLTSADTTSIRSNLDVGIPAAAAGAVVFAGISLVRGGLGTWWGLAGPDPTAGNTRLLRAALLTNHKDDSPNSWRARKDRDEGALGLSADLAKALDRPWNRTPRSAARPPGQYRRR